MDDPAIIEFVWDRVKGDVDLANITTEEELKEAFKAGLKGTYITKKGKEKKTGKDNLVDFAGAFIRNQTEIQDRLQINTEIRIKEASEERDLPSLRNIKIDDNFDGFRKEELIAEKFQQESIIETVNKLTTTEPLLERVDRIRTQSSLEDLADELLDAGVPRDKIARIINKRADELGFAKVLL